MLFPKSRIGLIAGSLYISMKLAALGSRKAGKEHSHLEKLDEPLCLCEGA